MHLQRSTENRPRNARKLSHRHHIFVYSVVVTHIEIKNIQSLRTVNKQYKYTDQLIAVLWDSGCFLMKHRVQRSQKSITTLNTSHKLNTFRHLIQCNTLHKKPTTLSATFNNNLPVFAVIIYTDILCKAQDKQSIILSVNHRTSRRRKQLVNINEHWHLLFHITLCVSHNIVCFTQQCVSHNCVIDLENINWFIWCNKPLSLHILHNMITSKLYGATQAAV